MSRELIQACVMAITAMYRHDLITEFEYECLIARLGDANGST